MKKEELIAKNAELSSSLQWWVKSDEDRRKEFAKAFAWFKRQQPYEYRNDMRDPMTPTWEQIFVNVGYLTAQRDFRNYEGNISELEVAVEAIKKDVGDFFKKKTEEPPPLR